MSTLERWEALRYTPPSLYGSTFADSQRYNKEVPSKRYKQTSADALDRVEPATRIFQKESTLNELDVETTRGSDGQIFPVTC